MAASMRVYVFGDQTYDIGDLLWKLLHSHNDPVLSVFFERCCLSLRHEVVRLGPDQQSECPRFSQLVDLVPLWRAGTLNPALSQALTCVCQLGAFIQEHGSGGKFYPTPQSACLTGLCTGSLAAVAVSCATSTPNLLSLALQTVVAAFRLGACAWDTATRLCTTRDASGRYPSWTAVLHGVSEEDVKRIIEDFATEKALSKTATPYISAYIASNQVSVSAPPEVTEALLAESSLGRHVVTRLPISAPYHAGHLYNQEDVEQLLSELDGQQTQWPINGIPIVSSITGKVVPTTTFPEALRTVVQDCLLSALRWDLTIDGIASQIRCTGYGIVDIHPIATNPDRLRHSLQKLLGSTTEVNTATDPASHSQKNGPFCSPCHTAKSKIAIVGMSGRFPRASSMDSFWDVLVNGIDTHELVPPSRWDARTHVNLAAPAKNISGTGFGCWLHDAAEFDARFFNMSPREAPQVDPAQRLALLTAAEALEQAGIVPGRTPSTRKDRVGVYFGSTSNDWMETNSAQNIDTYFIPGGNRAFIPGRINYHFKFSGPSYTIDTACSSSLAAIHLACNALWRGEVDTAIVGGTNVLTNPDMTAGLDRGHFLSRTGNCKTFDETADGYCRGEAVVTVILKRLDDAVSDNDPIQACILGIATNHSAEADSITRPHVGAQQALFESLLAETGVDAASISYTEMHGTGTQAGDAGETASVLQTLAPANPARKAHQPLHIGAAKANIGHGEAAAGVTSLAKILLMLKNSTIPPHCGIKTKINTRIPDLQARNTFIAKGPVPWRRPRNGSRHVLLNNFSAAGGNTALVLEDAPEMLTSNEADPRSYHVVAVSAKTPTSMENNLRTLTKWIETQPSDALTLPRLSYTTTARRVHHAHRVMAIGSDLAQIRFSLQVSLDRNEGSTRPKSAPKFVFAFTGQGSSFVGMGADLYNHLSDFRADIRRLDGLCVQLSLPSILSLFASPDVHQKPTPTTLQLASVCLQMALYRMWLSFGVTPSVVVGHSLGEYAALHAAGVMSQADVLNLVGQRAELMESRCKQGTHAMLAVRSNATALASVLGPPGHGYELSCINGVESVVLGGSQTQMKTIRPSLIRKGLSSKLLEVPYAFHTSQVDPIIPSLQTLARGVKFAKPRIPIISPTCGKVIRESADFGDDFVANHCRGSVNMYDALRIAKEEGLLDDKAIGVEIGPAPVVSRMVKEVAGPAFLTFASINQGEDTWKLLTQALANFHAACATIDWSRYHKDFLSCQQCLELPAYSWDLKPYWIQYVHDWSLRKGEPLPLALPPKLESSSVHKVLQDTLGSGGGELIVESDLNRPDLHPMVQGHQVYGVPLCTPSVYADIALTVGDRLKQIFDPDGSSVAVEVANMNIQSALVANSDAEPKLLRAVMQVDPQSKTATCTFSSVDNTGKVTEQHANCLLRLFNAEQVLQGLQDSASQALARMQSLKAQVTTFDNTYRFSKSMIYKMIGQLADFDPNYRGLVEITLDNDALEATGRVSFADVLNEGKFHTNPAYIDALSQLGGFVMNANETVDLDSEVFINHGWQSLQLFDRIDPNTTYYTHVKMREREDKLWTGDVLVFAHDRLVAVFGGVALQGVPKRLMQYIVTAANKRNAPAPDRSALRAPRQDSAVAIQSIAKTTIKKTEMSPQQPDDSLVVAAIQIVSHESGIAVQDLADDSRFDDIGIDSLLSLVISSRLRDEMSLDFESALFLELGTIGRLKVYLKGLSGNIQPPMTVTETVKEEMFSLPADGTWQIAIEKISEESGIAVGDLTDDTCFSDIGIDSLLSLVICSRLRDELDLDLPDRSLFMDHPTIGDLKRRIINGDPEAVHLDSGSSSPKTESFTLSSDHSAHSSPKNSSGTPDSEVEQTPKDLAGPGLAKGLGVIQDGPIRPAWSIVLQGIPRRARQRLFLFPDGCGAATSYLQLPPISDSVAVIGFNSPFMKNPHDMLGRQLPDVVVSYIEALRKHQPHGPYNLGGWSAGGIFAYAVARELIAAGEEVATLLLIDSPDPTKGLDRLPRRFFDHCAKVGIFGSELSASPVAQDSPLEAPKLPSWLMPHFEATIELLHDYRAPPMVNGKSPRVSLIWAGACAFDGSKYAPLPASTTDDEDTEGMKFLTKKRQDFGPGKWADLFPGRKIDVHVVEGEHHFSMMRGQGAERLAEFIRDALAHD